MLVCPRRWYWIYGNTQLTIECGISDNISESNTICTLFVIWKMIVYIYFPLFWTEFVPSFVGQIGGSTFYFQSYYCWPIQSAAKFAISDYLPRDYHVKVSSTPPPVTDPRKLDYIPYYPCGEYAPSHVTHGYSHKRGRALHGHMLKCEEAAVGRYVYVYLDTARGNMVLCELEVYGKGGWDEIR